MLLKMWFVVHKYVVYDIGEMWLCLAMVTARSDHQHVRIVT